MFVTEIRPVIPARVHASWRRSAVAFWGNGDALAE
jgi:hypothetical protein